MYLYVSSYAYVYVIDCCMALLSKRHPTFGGKKKGLVLGRCAMMAIFCVIWVERNKRIF